VSDHASTIEWLRHNVVDGAHEGGEKDGMKTFLFSQKRDSSYGIS